MSSPLPPAHTSSISPILDVQPTDIHQRVPVIMGSAGEVDDVLAHLAASSSRSYARPQCATGTGMRRRSYSVRDAIRRLLPAAAIQ